MKSEEPSERPGVDWENLPLEIVHLILEKLLPCSDFGRFVLASKTWLRAAFEVYSQQPQRYKIYDQIPLLSRFCFDFPPDDERTRVYGSSRGWLVSVDLVDNSITLFDPVQSKSIHLPPVTYQRNSPVLKVVVSPRGRVGKQWYEVEETDPIDEHSYMVAATLQCGGVLAYMTSDDENWTYLQRNIFGSIDDMFFRRGLLIMVNTETLFFATEIYVKNPSPFYFSNLPSKSRFGGDDLYFATSTDRKRELLIVRFYSSNTGIKKGRTEKFAVYQPGRRTPYPFVWCEVDSIGDEVIF